MKAVIYARGHNEASVENQINQCREHAQQKGWQVVAVYVDRCATGKDKQIACNQMIKDSQKGDFQIVLTTGLERITRRTGRYFCYVGELGKHGVKIVTIAKTDWVYDLLVEFMHGEKTTEQIAKTYNNALTKQRTATAREIKKRGNK